MSYNDPLSSMVHHIIPLGYTRPGYLPAARLSPHGTLVAQHHEALHHDFNTRTTLGNALILLMQIVERCPTSLSHGAFEVASKWSEAQSFRLEGLINYVCYKRVKRRMGTFTFESYGQLLPKIYRQAWHEWRMLYDTIEISDSSKDALAIHVGLFALNLPVYEILEDIDSLEKAVSAVTQELIHQRFQMIEDVLFSKSGRALLREWDTKMQLLWLQDLPDTHKQNTEADAIDRLLRQLLPGFVSIPRTKVVESIKLASIWNKQLEKLGLPASCRVKIVEKGYIDSLEELVVQPPAHSVTGLVPCENPKQVVELLEAMPDMYSLGIIHCEKGEGHTFSHKYKRTLRQGETYMRYSFVRPTSDCERYDIWDRHLFAVLKNEDLQHWLQHLCHPRLVLTNSDPGENIIDQIAHHSRLKPEQIWQIHWAKPVEWIMERIKGNADKVSWLNITLMLNSHTVFWLVQLQDQPWLDVYPVPWDVRDKLYSAHASLIDKARLGIERKMIYGILGIVINMAF